MATPSHGDRCARGQPDAVPGPHAIWTRFTAPVSLVGIAPLIMTASNGFGPRDAKGASSPTPRQPRQDFVRFPFWCGRVAAHLDHQPPGNRWVPTWSTSPTRGTALMQDLMAADPDPGGHQFADAAGACRQDQGDRHVLRAKLARFQVVPTIAEAAEPELQSSTWPRSWRWLGSQDVVDGLSKWLAKSPCRGPQVQVRGAGHARGGTPEQVPSLPSTRSQRGRITTAGAEGVSERNGTFSRAWSRPTGERRDTCFANPGTSEISSRRSNQTPGIHCVLGLQENVVTGMADGYWRIAQLPPPCCTAALGWRTAHNSCTTRRG
jgi:hypothetical protein